MSDDVRDQLARTARDAGVHAWVHASRLSGPPASVGIRSIETVAVASLYKLPLALCWAEAAAAGRLAADSRLKLGAARRMPGPTGIAMLLDDIVISARDAIRLMLAISDNACGDAILDLVGIDMAHATLERLGLPRTLIRQGSAEETTALLRETGASSWGAAQAALADPESDVETSQYDAAFASAGSAVDLTEVLRILWSRDSEVHALVRDALAHQAWRHRIASGFPHDDVTVYGKTGTVGRLRHETAVIRFPHEHPVAVSVLTRAVRPERHLPVVDRAIGELARIAVNKLRAPLGD